MSNYVTISNITFETISMEKVGVSYSSGYGSYMPILLNPVVVNLDLNDLQRKEEEYFNPSFIFFDNHYYYLRKNLNCRLSKKNNIYTIDCPLLKLKVFGKTKEEVVSAFNFSFHSLYVNFVNEDENKLSKGAKRLRNKLQTMVS